LPATEPGSRFTGQLVRVPLDRLVPHPANANSMSEEQLAKLTRNIEREGDYEPVVVRPHPTRAQYYELINGHHRVIVLGRLGYDTVLCYVWPCDDAVALTLLATLNRLEGQDDPLKRAELLRDLTALLPAEELAQLLPEDAAAIARSLELLDLNLDDVLADLQRQSADGPGLHAITFAVTSEDEATIEAAVRRVADRLDGANRRGRALAEIARAYDQGGAQ
jgi:ParB family chromosome partitioning protein